MRSCTSVVLLVICFSAMTSLSMQFGNYVTITNSTTGEQVCSTDTPTQVLPLSPEGEVRCGVVCMMSSCPYYQFKSSTPIQCELYSQFPRNFTKITNCIGFSIPDSYPTDCSFPFTFRGMLYNGCAPNGANGACLSVNRTMTLPCTINTATAVIDGTVSISNQSVPVQSIFGWIIWMRRYVPVTFNWNLPWASYKNGFGSVGDSNYWLGLERVYKLTSASKYRLRIEMKDKNTGIWYSVEYWSFEVGDEASTKYQLTVDGFSGDASNALQNGPGVCIYDHDVANGMKFTTIDADNDPSPKNCASIFKGGWWHKSCYNVCLTCNAETNYLVWNNANCTQIFLIEVRMLIKPQ